MSIPKSLLKKIEGSVEEAKLIPLWGSPPPFPLEEVVDCLKEALHIEDLTLSVTASKKRNGADLLAGMGDNPTRLAFALSPLAPPVQWVVSYEDMSTLTTLLLAPQKNKGFTDARLKEGFLRYICLEVLHAIAPLRPFGDLSLSFAPLPSLPKEALCLDVTFTVKGQSLWGRILCPLELQHALREHFALTKPPLSALPMTKEVEISLSIGLGFCTLGSNAIQKIAVGDWIFLEHCFFDPKTHKGMVTLSLGHVPLFQARPKEQKIHILDYAVYTRGAAMENEEEEIEFEAKEAPPLNPEEIPIQLTVEAGRIEMTLDKLLEIRPGNILDFPVSPEMGVDITVHGKRIAKGELVKLGEAIGVKILKLL